MYILYIKEGQQQSRHAIYYKACDEWQSGQSGIVDGFSPYVVNRIDHPGATVSVFRACCERHSSVVKRQLPRICSMDFFVPFSLFRDKNVVGCSIGQQYTADRVGTQFGVYTVTKVAGIYVRLFSLSGKQKTKTTERTEGKWELLSP